MSSMKPKQVEEFLEDSSEEEQDDDDKSKFMNFIDTNGLLGKLDANKLMQLLYSPTVKRRIQILEKFQLKTTNIVKNFFAEVYALECKYHKLYHPIYEKRKLIVTGAYEPTDQEAQWLLDEEDENLGNQLINKTTIEREETLEILPKISETKNKLDFTGIPNFWLIIFQNDVFLSDMVQPQDEPILRHLQDIEINCSENPMSFTLAFHFSHNKYFTNLVLTKEYFMKCELNADDPFNFEYPQIYKCKGCTITWNKGMNVTLTSVKKKQRHRSCGVVRTVTKTFENLSFFNFFALPEVLENGKEEEINMLRYLLTSDFEIGLYIREKIVPKAILFYLGDTVEDKADDYKKHNLKFSNKESEFNQEENNKAAKNAN